MVDNLKNEFINKMVVGLSGKMTQLDIQMVKSEIIRNLHNIDLVQKKQLLYQQRMMILIFFFCRNFV